MLSSGNRAYCYAEIVFSYLALTIASTHYACTNGGV